MRLPPPTSQNRTDPSFDAEARIVPSGEKDRSFTISLCPINSRTKEPSLEPHIRTEASSDPEAIRLPSGEYSTTITGAS